MRRLAHFTCALVIGVSMLSQAANARVVVTRNPQTDRSHWRPIFTVAPPRNVNYATLEQQARAGSTLPFFTNKIKSPLDGNTYTYDILGTDPTKTPASTTITYVPIAMKITFPGGVVLDPTKPGCNDTVSVEKRFFNSPLFHNVPNTSNGINVGHTQYEDAFMRAQFWKLVGGTGYHVLLAPSQTKVININITAPSGSVTQAGGCSGSNHDLGEIPYGAYQNLIANTANMYATPSQLPVILAYNTVQTFGGCCIIGFHGAYGRSGGTQVYATGSYTDPNEFDPIVDMYAWTHEIGEAFDDPFINNGTPAWGNVGQVSGCQNNLEVGDPLTGSPAVIIHHKGFNYHGQELAFFDWFYRTPSNGTAGKYSYEGTFTTAQGACH